MEGVTETKLMNLTKKQLVKRYLAYKRTINVEVNVSFNFNLIPLIF
jgi:hypothetical protein